jgi:hypothetical protein
MATEAGAFTRRKKFFGKPVTFCAQIRLLMYEGLCKHHHYNGAFTRKGYPYRVRAVYTAYSGSNSETLTSYSGVKT